jgi:hypothetical protein
MDAALLSLDFSSFPGAYDQCYCHLSMSTSTGCTRLQSPGATHAMDIICFSLAGRKVLTLSVFLFSRRRHSTEISPDQTTLIRSLSCLLCSSVYYSLCPGSTLSIRNRWQLYSVHLRPTVTTPSPFNRYISKRRNNDRNFHLS